VHYVPYSEDSRYAAFKRSDDKGEVHVAMQVQPLYTYVTIIESKPMDTGMAKVTAEALGKDLLAAGHVAVYDIRFDSGRADIKPESADALTQIAALLTKEPALKLFVVGHTDNVGSLAANLDLSKRRAAAVVAALTGTHKIAAARLTADGVGQLAPVASNDADAGRAINRRVELVKQ
jgi:outer membrane protein OmpA-like peptidoglycan-associated protein